MARLFVPGLRIVAIISTCAHHPPRRCPNTEAGPTHWTHVHHSNPSRDLLCRMLYSQHFHGVGLDQDAVEDDVVRMHDEFTDAW